MLGLRKISSCTIGLALTAAFHAAVAAGSATVVDVQQQVGLEVGYRMHGVDHILLSDLDPPVPQGRSDADLKVSTARYGASGSATLNSRFHEDRFSIKGLAAASAAWRSPPKGAEGINTASATTFLARFETGPVPALFHFDGSIGVGLAKARGPHSREMSVHVKLVTGSGIPLWQAELHGADREPLKAVSFSETLLPNQEYRFALHAEASALSEQEQGEIGFCAAWFDLEAEVATAPVVNGAESRALLVTITPELEVLQVDGRPIDSSQITERRGFREHSIPVGEHTIRTAFRRTVPVTYDSIENLKGSPLSLTHFFLGGHKYVLLHRAHASRETERIGAIEKIVRSVFRPSRSRWSAELIDLAHIRRQIASIQLRRAKTPPSEADRQTDEDPEAMVERLAATRDANRLGLTGQEINAILRYLTLETEGATGTSLEGSIPRISP